jgi:hypothetical protein
LHEISRGDERSRGLDLIGRNAGADGFREKAGVDDDPDGGGGGEEVAIGVVELGEVEELAAIATEVAGRDG